MGVSLTRVGKMLTPKNVVVGVILTNMVCRPLITLANKNLPEQTKRYTAVREFGTELFGLFNTFTFASAVEYLVPKLIHNKLTRKVLEQIKAADWSKLSVADQKVKATILISSFVGTLVSAAILTPLLNNLVLNRLMDKIMGKNKRGVSAEITKNNSQPFPSSLQLSGNPVFANFITRKLDLQQ